MSGNVKRQLRVQTASVNIRDGPSTENVLPARTLAAGDGFVVLGFRHENFVEHAMLKITSFDSAF